MSSTNLSDHRILAAGALAVVAAVLTMIYVAHGGGSATAKASRGATATVYVAVRDIPVGTATANLFARGYVKAKPIAIADVAAGAITDRRQLTGLVAVQQVYAGEQLTERRFGSAGAAGVLSDLYGTMRVIQIAGDPQQLLAGILKPGDHVDVLASLGSGSSGTGATAGARVATVLRDLLVLDAGTTQASGVAAGTAQNYVTLRLDDRQARTLFAVVKSGDWSFVLRPFVRPTDTSGTVDPASLAAGS